MKFVLTVLLIITLSIVGMGSVLALMGMHHASNVRVMQKKAESLGLTYEQYRKELDDQRLDKWMNDNENYGANFVSKLP